MTVELYLLNRIESLERQITRLAENDPFRAEIEIQILELKRVLDFIQN